jgi:hypothetical protein
MFLPATPIIRKRGDRKIPKKLRNVAGFVLEP